MVLPKEVVNDKALADVISDYTKAKTSTKKWHNNVKEWRSWYNFQHYKNRGVKKPGEERFNDPTPTNVVDLAVGVILAHPLEWRAVSLNQSLVEQEETSRVEKYLQGTIDANNLREDYNIQYETILHAARDGGVVIFTAWDPELAREYDEGMRPVPDPRSPQGVRPVQYFNDTPIRVQVVDPLKCYWLKGGPFRWEQVFRSEEMSVLEVENLYGVQLRNYAHYDERMKREATGELIDAWRWVKKIVPVTDQNGQPAINPQTMEPETKPQWVVQRGLLFDNEFIWPMQDTPYKRLPYELGFYKPLDRDEPAWWSVGAIQPLQTTVEHLENSINRRARQITVLASLPVVTKAMQGRNIRIDSALGQHLPLRVDEDIAFPKWPGNPPDVSDHISFLRSRLQQAGFAETSFGEGASAVSGYAMDQQTDHNKIRLEQPVVHMEHLFRKIGTKIMELTSTFAPDAAIHVTGNLRGKAFQEAIISKGFKDYSIEAKLKPEFPGEESRKVSQAVQSKGMLSLSTILERYYDIQQPDDEIDKIIMDQARMHPMVIQYSIMKNLEELAETGDEIAQLVIQQMQAQVAEGQQGQSPQGPQPGNLVGTPSADGSQTPQAQGQEPPGQGSESFLNQLLGALPKLGGGS